MSGLASFLPSADLVMKPATGALLDLCNADEPLTPAQAQGVTVQLVDALIVSVTRSKCCQMLLTHWLAVYASQGPHSQRHQAG